MNKIVEKFKKDMQGSRITKQEGTMSLLTFGSITPAGFKPYINKYYDFDFKAFIFTEKNKHGIVFFDLDVYSNLTRASFKRYLKLKEGEELAEYTDFFKIWEKINKHYEACDPEKLVHLSDEEIDKLMKESFHLEAELFAATVFSEALEEDITKEFYEIIKADKKKFNEFFSVASQSAIESFVIRMDKILVDFNLKEKPLKNQWILADYYSVPVLSEVNKTIEKMIIEKGGAEEIKKELEIQEKMIKENKSKINKLKKSLSKDEKKLVDFMQLAIYVRDARKETIQKISTPINNVCREIFKRKGLAEEDAVYGYYFDFIDGNYKNKEYAKEIEERKKGYVSYYNGESYEISHEDVDQVNKEVYELMYGDVSETKEIKGNIGCKGYVKAKARIVLSEKDFSKFKQGDVLVTSMTRPEFVPLMKLASAVVTDEGGITCHAAIISREMNKPCIIGTKNATRILKDDMDVEVDADNGVARIL